MNQTITNPNEHKVVSFHNSTDFGFTPEMGCMYDGRPINGKNGSPGIDAGETIILPYDVAHRLATNLAKIALVRTAPAVDPAGIPTGVPLWDTVKLEALKNSYLTDLYSETRPAIQSETDKLIAKVEELNKWKQDLEAKQVIAEVNEVQANVVIEDVKTPEITEELKTETTVVPEVIATKQVFLDKAEVIAELTKRGIQHDKRKNKDELEKLLA